METHVEQPMQPPLDSRARPSYGPLARALHWIMALLIVVQAGMGLIMVHEAPEPNVWATLTNAFDLYSVHKSLGILLLLLVLVRLANRIIAGVPPDHVSSVSQRETANLVHAWMYWLLLIVPALGWIGISLYPALVVFDAVALPALLPPDRPASEPVFVAHRIAAFMLLSLIGLHVVAALYHQFIRRDGLLRRMLPSRSE